MALRGEDGYEHVVVHFSDNEVLEGIAIDLDPDAPDFEVVLADPDTNSRRALIPFSAVKRVTLSRPTADPIDSLDDLPKVALRFHDGEVLHGLLERAPRRGRYGVVVRLVSPDGDAVETVGMPHDALKALFYLRTWEGGLGEGVDLTRAWDERPRETPLIELLGEIKRLSRLRDHGEISDEDFRRRRNSVLDLL